MRRIIVAVLFISALLSANLSFAVERVGMPPKMPPVGETESRSIAIRVPEPQLGTAETIRAINELRQKHLLMPIEGVDPERLKGSYYEGRNTGKHHAVDILAPRNTPIRACDDGKIVRLFHSQYGGTTIYQCDRWGQYIYYYAHLERYADGLMEGDRIHRGQIIGYVGTSGNAPPNTPHLHFSISKPVKPFGWYPSAPIDPYEVFVRQEVQSFLLSPSMWCPPAMAAPRNIAAVGDQRKAKRAGRKMSGSFVNGKMTLNKNTLPVNGFHVGQPVVVIVDKGNHVTYVLQKQAANRVVKVFSTANGMGKPTLSPYGRFTVVDKLKWPSWIPPKSIDPKQKALHPYNKDRKNPLGVARISLNRWGIVLHGTNEPSSVGKSVSHGCIRHSNKGIQTMYNMVNTGTPVYIVSNFDGKTISLSDFRK